MTAYLLTVSATALIAIYSNRSERAKRTGVVLITIVWGALFALRNRVGTDFGTYYGLYSRAGNESITVFLSTQRDFLFGLITYICNKISNGNWIFYQAVVAILIYLPVLLVFKRKSESMLQSCLLYIFTLTLFSGFNGTRQALATSFLFYGYYTYYIQKKKIGTIVCLLIAFGFHSSVILAIPFLMLSQKSLNSKVVITSFVGLIIAYVFIWQIWPLLINFLRLVGQTKMADDYMEVSTEKGSGFLRALVIAVPFLIALLRKKQFTAQYLHAENEIILSGYAVLFMFLSMRYWIFSRVAAYFAISQMMLIPKLSIAFSKESQKIFILLLLVLYFAYMVAMLLHGEGWYYPYVSLLAN